MSHELTIRQDGSAEMFSGRGITPWHGLGRVIPGTADRSNVLELAGLDWTVSAQPMYRYLGGELVAVDTANVIQRDDTGVELGTAGKRYGLLQNDVLADVMDAVVANGARYETAGSLFGGKVVWFLMNLDDIGTARSVHGDELGKYILGLTSHDRSYALTLRRVAIRTVCANTLSWGLADARKNNSPVYRINHTSNAKARLDLAREALGLSVQYFTDFDAEVARLMDTPADFEEVVDTIAPTIKPGADVPKARITTRAKVRDGLWTAYVSDEVGEQWMGTAWGAVQAANTFEMWGKSVKVNGKDKDLVKFESQARSILSDQFLLTEATRKLFAAAV